MSAWPSLILTTAFAACARSGRPPSPAGVGAPPASTTSVVEAQSWGEARAAARASLQKHDYSTYRQQIAALYERSRSIWVLRDLARADALLGDKVSAIANLATVARAGVALRVEGDPTLAPLSSDPSFSAVRDRFAANATPVTRARALFALPREDLVAEDVVYDPSSRTFFVSSVRHRKILAFDAAGRARDFIGEGAAGLLSVSGLALARGRLWATTSAMPPMVGFDPKTPAPTALVAFDIRDGSLVARIEAPSDGREHLFTDLAATPDGTLLVADNADPMLYALPASASALEPLAPRGEFVSPQTAGTSVDGRTAYVPDYVRGIAAVELPHGRLRWLAHADDVAVAGIDGIYVDEDGSLLVVQNGIEPPRLARMVLNDERTRIARADVLERATPGFVEPTHGVFVDDKFVFIAAAGWTRFDDGGHMLPDAPPDAPALWSLLRPARASR